MATLKATYVSAAGITGLRPLLDEWIKLQQHYIAYMDNDDCPWTYNEVAVTGFLAAAAWKMGGVALQEYRTSKGRLKKDRWAGRCDLYTYVKPNAFVMECKLYRTNIGSSHEASLTHIQKTLSDAADDAKQHSPKDGVRLGVCFVAPFFAAKKAEHSEKMLSNWCSDLRTRIKPSAIAWQFLDQDTARSIQKNGRYSFPGVVALIKRV